MSAEGLKVEQMDGVLVLTLANPPTHVVSAALRRALVAAIQTPPEPCHGIVIVADGLGFSRNLAGQPASGEPGSEPSLAALCRVVAESPIPVVAVVSGLIAGPGAELALAARARLAAANLRIAFPEVLVGLCPSGGSTQRLPQLIGAKAALSLLLTGKTVPAPEALSMGLIDGIAESTPLAAAIRLARALCADELLTRQVQDPGAWTVAVASARREQATAFPAGQRIVDCVEAALLLPIENGLAFEAAARDDLEMTAEAAALGYLASAERRALVVPVSVPGRQPLAIEQLGLSGSDPDLARLAISALARGLTVTWVLEDENARKAGLAAVEAGLESGARSGAITSERAVAMKARLITTDNPSALSMAALVVQDQSLTADAQRSGPPGAAHLVLDGAEGALGLSLTPSARMCELVLPPGSDPLVKTTAVAGLRRIGLQPLVVGHRPVLGERLADSGRTALAWMVAQGVPRRLIASTLDGFGVRLPDIGALGAPTALRAMSGAEVLNRWLAALANEGARLLDEKIALRSSDIDQILVAGYQFPRWRGGPMHQADLRGLLVLRHDLRVWAADGPLWSPAPLIDRLIQEGRAFASLDL